MPCIAYTEPRLGARRLATIEKANEIIEEYMDQGSCWGATSASARPWGLIGCRRTPR